MNKSNIIIAATASMSGIVIALIVTLFSPNATPRFTLHNGNFVVDDNIKHTTSERSGIFLMDTKTGKTHLFYLGKKHGLRGETETSVKWVPVKEDS